MTHFIYLFDLLQLLRLSVVQLSGFILPRVEYDSMRLRVVLLLVRLVHHVHLFYLSLILKLVKPSTDLLKVFMGRMGLVVLLLRMLDWLANWFLILGSLCLLGGDFRFLSVVHEALDLRQQPLRFFQFLHVVSYCVIGNEMVWCCIGSLDLFWGRRAWEQYLPLLHCGNWLHSLLSALVIDRYLRCRRQWFLLYYIKIRVPWKGSPGIFLCMRQADERPLYVWVCLSWAYECWVLFDGLRKDVLNIMLSGRSGDPDLIMTVRWIDRINRRLEQGGSLGVGGQGVLVDCGGLARELGLLEKGGHGQEYEQRLQVIDDMVNDIHKEGRTVRLLCCPWLVAPLQQSLDTQNPIQEDSIQFYRTFLGVDAEEGAQHRLRL